MNCNEIGGYDAMKDEAELPMKREKKKRKK